MYTIYFDYIHSLPPPPPLRPSTSNIVFISPFSPSSSFAATPSPATAVHTPMGVDHPVEHGQPTGGHIPKKLLSVTTAMAPQ